LPLDEAGDDSNVSPDANRFVGVATATGFGDDLGYTAFNLGIVRKEANICTISARGNVAPVSVLAFRQFSGASLNIRRFRRSLPSGRRVSSGPT